MFKYKMILSSDADIFKAGFQTIEDQVHQ